MNKSKKWMVIIFWLFLAIIIVSSLIAILQLPRIPDDLNRIALQNPTKIYADDGRLIRTLANRQTVPIEEISPDLLNAVVALEDNQFFKHHGINKRGLLRAAFTNLKAGRVRQGGSSITQQLAKNLFFTFKRSYLRKIQEVFVTLQIERQFSKNEILEAYVNQVDFGSGIYGVELAAQTYFAKHADELSLAQAAMLAGIPRWAVRYNPYRNPQIAKERQQFVLKRMLDEKYISQETHDQSVQEKLQYLRMNNINTHADYFIDYVLKNASDEFGSHAVMYGGMDIHTSLNVKFQIAASQAVYEGLARLDDLMGLVPYKNALRAEWNEYPQAALVAIDVKTGEIKALVGGRDFRRAPFNRAVANSRQPGSAFKLFTYLPAIDKGIYTPTSVLIDQPVEFPLPNQSPWRPDNYDHVFRGPIILKYALAHSVNTIAAQVINEIHPETTVEYARMMGITSDIQPNLSLALGATSVSPLEMAAAYSTLASEGIRHDPYAIKQINADKKVLSEASMQSKRVVDQQSAYIMIDMMRGVVEEGTAKSIRNAGFNRDCAGKTGTTNDSRDAWFVGFTPDLAVAVWVGYDDNRRMKTKWGGGVAGGTAALPIWIRFMKKALASSPYTEFVRPSGIDFYRVNTVTGEIVSDFAEGMPVAVRSNIK